MYDIIRLGAVNGCNNTLNKIFENILSREELHDDELILDVEIEISDDES